MNKVLYFIPLLLTGCLSTGSSDEASTPSTHPGRQPPLTNPGSNPSSGNKDTLNTFIDTDKFEKNVTNENNSNIRQALQNAKVAATDNNINIATDALKQNLNDSNYISSKISKLNDVIAIYPNYEEKLKEFDRANNEYSSIYYDGKYDGRKSFSEQVPNPDYDEDKDIDDTNPEFIMQTRNESDSEFASRLLQIVGNKYADFGNLSAEEYIVTTLHKWAEDIQDAMGGGKSDIILDDTKIEEQFNSIYSELKSIKTKIDEEYYSAKSDLLKKIQSVDSSIKEFPLSLENLMAYYQLEQSILKAIESIDYINQSNPTSFSYTATSLNDDEENKTVKFIYDENSNSYILSLSDIRIIEDTDIDEDDNISDEKDKKPDDEDEEDKEPIKTIREVKFKASDFVSTNNNYYMASKVINIGDSVVYKTYFNNLKDYINAGGNYDFEIQKRKNEASNIIKRVIYNQYPTKEDIDYFNNWFGTSLSENFTQSDISSCLSEAQLAISILAKTNSIFDILQVNKITDTVKLGGPSLKLSYSDFGLWTIRESTEYTGDKDLIAAKKDTDVENTYSYIDNPFFTGLDEFKAGFKSQPDAGINEAVKFSGKTFAVAQKGDTRKDLTGNATLSIDKQDATGSVNLAFDKWYNFTFNGIDFSNPTGFALNDTTVSVNNAVYDTDIKITSSKDEVKGNIAGSLYGPDVNTPTEGVGAYNITTGDDVKVNGAFGVKK